MASYTARANVASAGALTLPEGSNYFVVTGVTTITSISSRPSGELITLRFSDVLTLTYSATALILQGTANLVTVAGDVIMLISEGSGNWREVSRRLVTASGLTRVGGSTTEVTHTGDTNDTEKMTISGLSIPAGTPIKIALVYRKTTGAAAAMGVGVKLNGSFTLVGTSLCTSATNQAEDGLMIVEIGPRITNYVCAVMRSFTCYVTATGAVAVVGGPVSEGIVVMPVATVTSIIFTIKLDSALITGGIGAAHIYTYSV